MKDATWLIGELLPLESFKENLYPRLAKTTFYSALFLHYCKVKFALDLKFAIIMVYRPRGGLALTNSKLESSE